MTPGLERQLTQLKQGDHVCLIYENTAEQLAAAIPFLKEGFARGERCIYAGDGPCVDEAVRALAAAGVDVAHERRRGAFQSLPARDVYLRVLPFNPHVTLDFVNQVEAEALAAGFSGVRFTAVMTPALWREVARDWSAYEAMLNRLPLTRSVILCQYPRAQLDPACIDGVFRTHPLAVLGDQLYPNPYYEPPEPVPGGDRPAAPGAAEAKRVGWWLAQLQKARAAEQAIRQSHALLQAVVEGTTDAVFVKDRQGRYLMINSAGARSLGKSVAEVLGKDDAELLTPETASPIMEDDRRIMATGETQTHERVATAAGVTRTYLVTRGPYRDPDGNVLGVVGIGRDIAAAKALQVERDRLLDRLRLQIDRLPLAYILFDPDVRVLDWNPAAEKMFGYTKEEALGRWLLDLIVVHPLSESLQEVLCRVLAGDMEAHNVNQNRTRDGRTITCEWFNTPLRGEDGRVTATICLAQDVTERERAEEALRDYARRLGALSRRVVEVQEQERRRLARELHDEIGQVLSTVAVRLHALKGACAADVAPQLEEDITMVAEAIHQVRNLALDLRPAMLDDLGLVATLRWCADRWAQCAGFTVHFAAASSAARLPPDLETACYRVAQEALTNVARHARAHHVWLVFQQDEEEVRLLIRDDGVGFDPVAVRRRAARGASFGVVGMQERVELLGGHIDIDSRPAWGTAVRVRFPLAAGPEAQQGA